MGEKAGWVSHGKRQAAVGFCSVCGLKIPFLQHGFMIAQGHKREKREVSQFSCAHAQK